MQINKLNSGTKIGTSSRGFSLIELLVVLVIMGLLAGLVGPQLFRNIDKAKVETTEAQIKMLKTSLQAYRLDMGRFPTTEQGLRALMARPSSGANIQFWQGPYLDDALPSDGWENSFQYRAEPSEIQEFVLYSFGKDGAEGGEGYDKDLGYLPLSSSSGTAGSRSNDDQDLGYL